MNERTKKIVVLSVGIAIIIVITVISRYIHVWQKDTPGFPRLTMAGSLQKFYGYINNVQTNVDGLRLEIDYIDFLSGDEAYKRAIEDSGCPRETVEQCVPSLNNNFYIRNIERTNITYSLYKDVDVYLLKDGSSPVLTEVKPMRFMEMYRKKSLGLNKVPFLFEARGETITKVEQKYVP